MQTTEFAPILAILAPAFLMLIATILVLELDARKRFKQRKARERQNRRIDENPELENFWFFVEQNGGEFPKPETPAATPVLAFDFSDFDLQTEAQPVI